MKNKKTKTTKPKRRTKEALKAELPPISLFVRNRREEMGYTQEQLAFRSGLSVRFIKEFERGKRTVRLDKVNELLEFLGAYIEVRTRSQK